MEVYNVKKSYVCNDVAVRKSNWSRDENRHVELFSMHMLLTPLQLVLSGTGPYQSILNGGEYLSKKG